MRKLSKILLFFGLSTNEQQQLGMKKLICSTPLSGEKSRDINMNRFSYSEDTATT